MKLNLLAVLATLPAVVYAQENNSLQNSDQYPNTFTSGSANVRRFDNSERRFNDWAISVGGGTAFMQSADLISIRKDNVKWGWNAYVSLDKQISHTFGLVLQYNTGETNQTGVVNDAWGMGVAKTKFHQVNLLGDVNFSNLLRRVDNNSHYRWALHGYAGIGLQGYESYVKDNSTRWNNGEIIEQKMDIASFFFQGGLGLKYKVSRRVDVEARTMYIISGDDEFDGGGWESDIVEGGARQKDYPYNYIKKNTSDNMFTVNLGLSFKLGKHLSHLAWHDPLQEAYFRASQIGNDTVELVVCKKGDNDNDGVCDDWDRQLNTPAGARVDGAGVALDVDLDGVIDLYDKCVTIPGLVENDGCPKTPIVVDNRSMIETVNKYFEGIEFELNRDVIRPQSFDKLNDAAEVIKSLNPNDKFLVIGTTDTRGSVQYNLSLS